MASPAATARWATERCAPAVSRCLEEGLRQGVGPAIACVGSVGGQIFHRQALGEVAPPARERCRHSTLFDLDALTMPLGAGAAAMWGVGRGRIDLATTLARVVPGFAASRWGQASLERLLDHTAGLPAALPLHQQLAEAERFLHPKERSWGRPAAAVGLARLLAAAPAAAAAERSGPGFLALGWALERLLAAPLDVSLRDHLLSPLGLADEVMFLPPGARAAGRAAAGPMCPVRGRAPRGESLDLNAWAQGGVAGHAGLFATAQGAWRLAQALVEAQRGDASLLHPATVARFWSRSRHEAPLRALAWQRPPAGGATSGRLPRTAVGFVAARAAVWIEPASQFVGVVLTGGAAPPAAGIMATFLGRAFARLVEAAAGPPAGDAAALLAGLES